MCAFNEFVFTSSSLVRVLQREVLLLELSLFMVSHGNVQEAVDVLSRYGMTTLTDMRGQKVSAVVAK